MNRSGLACAGWLALAGLGLASQSGVKLAIVNESPSLQKGLYLRGLSAPQAGAIVALPPPPGARAYLAGLGFPTSVLLLKRIAAVEGDLVCAAGDTLVTPQRREQLRIHDRRGRLLPHWRGCGRLRAGELFLLGDTDESFDSRYFGPVRTADLKGVFWGAVTW